MNSVNKTRIIPFLLISLLLHFVLILTLEQLIDFSKEIEIQTLSGSSKPLRIRTVKEDELERYKSFGVKTNTRKYQIEKDKKKKKEERPVDFSSLQMTAPLDQIQPTREKVEEKVQHQAPDVDNFLSPKTYNEKIAQKRFLKKITPERFLDPVLSRSDFALSPDLPGGGKYDELNTAEKIYYSFKRRTLEQYLSSFVYQYQNLKKSRPYLKNKLLKGDHVLSGRIIFDKDGNIMSIKIIKSSPDDDIHLLFEETLKGIGKVPNPPKDFVSKDDQFSIYYLLHIDN